MKLSMGMRVCGWAVVCLWAAGTAWAQDGYGSIVAWGENYDGQCNVPAPNTDFVAVAAGSYYSLGIMGYPRGDLDGDGDVDLDDVGVFADCLAGPEVSTPPGECTQEQFDVADLDADNDVDLADFAVFQRKFTGPR